MNSCLPYRLEKTELVLFLILTFGGSTTQNSRQGRKLLPLALIESSYISSLYGIYFLLEAREVATSRENKKQQHTVVEFIREGVKKLFQKD